ncbi:MAG: thioesterase family protein [Nitriliruptoraceae bacterium]
MTATGDLPVFHLDGSTYVATSLARGPWDPRACHGGAPAALVAAAVDATPSLEPMQGVRLTYDLVRPVPVGVPLHLDTEVVREGRRIQVVDVRLATAADDVELVRCRALRIRTTALALPEDRPLPGTGVEVAPEDLPRVDGPLGPDRDGFWTAVDVRVVGGELGDAGPGEGWFRLVAPLTDGGPASELVTTPLVRVAATGDFGNGIGAPLAMGGGHRYINPDLTIDLHRLPMDEWVSLAARSVAEPHGIGLTTGVLGDRRGTIGSSLQSLFIEAG